MDTNNQNGTVTNNANVDNVSTQQKTSVETPKTFDEMLKDSNYQSEFDKRVQKSLETAKSKWLAEQEENKSEAEKLAKMKEDERNQYELKKAQKKQEETQAELNAYKLKEQAIKLVNYPETQIDVSLLELINFKTIKAEEVEPAIKNIKKVVDSAVENEVNKRLRESTPTSVINEGFSSTKNVSRTSY